MFQQLKYPTDSYIFRFTSEPLVSAVLVNAISTPLPTSNQANLALSRASAATSRTVGTAFVATTLSSSLSKNLTTLCRARVRTCPKITSLKLTRTRRLRHS